MRSCWVKSGLAPQVPHVLQGVPILWPCKYLSVSKSENGHAQIIDASLNAPGWSPTPLEVKLRKAEKRLDLKYSDGKQFSLPAELLRVCSPSADNQRPGRMAVSTMGRISARLKGLLLALEVVAGRRYVGIMGIQPVGRYAMRIQFDDLHHTGLYTWELLYDLGRYKLSRARQYIRQLRSQGLSREPARRRSVV